MHPFDAFMCILDYQINKEAHVSLRMLVTMKCTFGVSGPGGPARPCHRRERHIPLTLDSWGVGQRRLCAQELRCKAVKEVNRPCHSVLRCGLRSAGSCVEPGLKMHGSRGFPRNILSRWQVNTVLTVRL